MIENLNDSWNLTQTFNKTILINAAANSNKEIVELLLRQERVDVNMKDILNQSHSQYLNLTFSWNLIFEWFMEFTLNI